jgi:hypothetical protein
MDVCIVAAGTECVTSVLNMPSTRKIGRAVMTRPVTVNRSEFEALRCQKPAIPPPRELKAVD